MSDLNLSNVGNSNFHGSSLQWQLGSTVVMMTFHEHTGSLDLSRADL